MKKAFALLLTLALIATMTVASFAVEVPAGDEGASATLSASYTSGFDYGVVYGVELDWNGNSMVFKYNAGTQGAWDAENHEYAAPTDAGWEVDTLTITVKNHSNAQVYTSVSVRDVAGDDITVAAEGTTEYTMEQAFIGTSYDDATPYTFTVKATGTPAGEIAGTVATATVKFNTVG